MAGQTDVRNLREGPVPVGVPVRSLVAPAGCWEHPSLCLPFPPDHCFKPFLLGSASLCVTELTVVLGIS